MEYRPLLLSSFRHEVIGDIIGFLGAQVGCDLTFENIKTPGRIVDFHVNDTIRIE